MTRRHAVVLVLCLVAGAIVGLPAVAAQETTTDTATNATADGPGLGTQLTAFLQSSSAATNDSVENGMWQAGFDRANESKRAQMVTDRTGSLEQRLERLRERNQSLQRSYENGDVPEPAFVARQSRLAARIDALRTAVNATDQAAAVAGVEDARLERLKQNASELSGPQVSAIARGFRGGGPPADVPGQSESETDEQNTSASGRDQRAGEQPAAPGQSGDAGAPGGDAKNPVGGDGADPGNSDAANSSDNETADTSDDSGNGNAGDGSAGDSGNGNAGDGSAGDSGNDNAGDGSAGDSGNDNAGDGGAGNPGNDNAGDGGAGERER